MKQAKIPVQINNTILFFKSTKYDSALTALYLIPVKNIMINPDMRYRTAIPLGMTLHAVSPKIQVLSMYAEYAIAVNDAALIMSNHVKIAINNSDDVIL